MKFKVGVIQLTSVLDYRENLKKIASFLEEAKTLGTTHIFLPEVFYSISNGLIPTPYLVKKGNEHYQNIQNLAKKFNVFLLGGSAATVCPTPNKSFNRAYFFSPKGIDLGHYDKINLFSCDFVKDGERKKINEGRLYKSGTKLKIIEAGKLKIGASICFDLRFPQLYQQYVNKGAHVMTVSSAFTKKTGQAHWHTLLRARAIECQSFVVASAQWGDHNERISTYGHSLIIDPWGEILTDAGEGEKLIHATIDLSKIKEVRKMVKVFN